MTQISYWMITGAFLGLAIWAVRDLIEARDKEWRAYVKQLEDEK